MIKERIFEQFFLLTSKKKKNGDRERGKNLFLSGKLSARDQLFFSHEYISCFLQLCDEKFSRQLEIKGGSFLFLLPRVLCAL